MLTLYVADVPVQAEIGVNPSELLQPQRLLIGIELEVTPPRDPTADQLSGVVDYGGCIAIIERAVAAGRVRLLETLAHRIGQACLSDPRVQAATVRIDKPTLLPGGARAGLVWRFVQGSDPGLLSQ